MFRMKKVPERGQALLLIVIGIVGLIGLTALAVDGGNAYADRRAAQNAADAAALAAALAKVRGEDPTAAALARASANGYEGSGANTVEVHYPPISGPYAGNSEYVQVIITSRVNTYFAPVVGIQEVTNRTEAVAHAKPPTPVKMYAGNAVVSLAPHDCDATWVHGNAKLTVEGGGMYTRSDCTAYAFRQVGSGQLIAPSISVVGGASWSNGHVIPAPQTGAAALPDPVFPNPVCEGNAERVGNKMTPGNYSGTFPPNGVQYLDPGMYCVNGDFRLNGGDTLTGSDVVIVMLSGGVTWNGNSSANLRAPTNGPFKGLLLYQPPSNTSTMTINGNSDMHLTGTILAPSALVRLLGTGAVDGFQSQVVGYTVEFGGTSDGIIRYNDQQNYLALTKPVLELTK